MKVKKLIKDLDVEVARGSKEVEISGITNHSKSVGPGFLYIACKGETFDGNDYIPDAILAGASAILTDFFNPFLENVVQLITKDVKKLEAILASRFYHHPSDLLYTVGVTGTNGKTTSTYLASHILNEVELCGLMGTIERRIGEYILQSDLTTPDCITCQKMLYEVVHRGGKSVCMEVSSHALVQNRVDEVHFDLAVFTNLTPEHLDYHRDMESYAAAKKLLFKKIKPSGKALINIDDPRAKEFIAICDRPVITYGIDHEADIRASNFSYTIHETVFTVTMQDREFIVKMPLLGKFNVYNALVAIGVAINRGVSIETIQKALLKPPMIRGRMERIAFGDNTIFVDFAHKEHALQAVLESLRHVSKGKIITIFGCGGNRDREKRPKMAAVAEEYSDKVIVTNDNPRGEDPEEIVSEIIKGFKKDHFVVILDRKEAIREGIESLNSGDILLIAGKGHEKSQLFQGKTLEFDDALVAKELLNSLV